MNEVTAKGGDRFGQIFVELLGLLGSKEKLE
jgi:hypothetical protein